MKPGLLLTFLLLFTMACGQSGDRRFEAMLDKLLEGTVTQITPAQLAVRLETEPEMILLDAREKPEFEVSHLEGARHIGFENFDPSSLAGIDKETPIVVYCSVGKRSEIIGEKLRETGFTRVENLRGGIFDWANQDLPLVSADDKETSAVHPFNRQWGRWLAPGVEQQYEVK